MNLRNFLYLNTKILEDYLSVIDGFTYEEEEQAIANSSENTISGSGGIPIVKGEGAHSGKKEKEIKRMVKINHSAKFDKLYKYLESYEDLEYFEKLSEKEFNRLMRDDFIEVLVTPRFSKLKALADTAKQFSVMLTKFQELTDEITFDKKSRQVIDGIGALDQLNSDKEISCVFEFENKKYPLVSCLDSSFFRCEQESFVGQEYLLCKIVRKVPVGQNIKLDEIFEKFKDLPLNRYQRRNMPETMDNPSEFRDVIPGPAIIVLPIAVYQ